MSWTVMPEYASQEVAREAFAWDLPDAYNPAVDLLRNHDAGTDRVALEQAYPDGRRASYTFRELDDLSDRLAGGLADLGVGPGDRVAVVLSQTPQNPITHLACWKLGAVSVPLSVLYGEDALRYRLADAGVTVAVADPAVGEDLAAVRPDCPDLAHVAEVVGSDAEPTDGAVAFEEVLADPGASVEPYDATPGTDSVVMYTSGSTGPPKGVLHSHAMWLGRAAASYNYFDQNHGPGTTVWTPSDWAWGSALGGTLFATWHHGGTMVGYPSEGFDAEAAFELLAEFDVDLAFVPPTALRLLMGVEAPAERWELSLSTIAAAGEALTPEVVDWVADGFGDVAINEYYGQTELNLVVGNSSTWFETRPGSMGKPLPGYEVAILDPEAVVDGEAVELSVGEVGEIAVRPDDRRVFFEEYLGQPEKTAAKTVDGWFLTGDLAERDADGYIWFKSRKDDVIITAGYRVGPTEVEEAVLEHPAAVQAGVVGVPDDTRGEIIKAFVEVSPDAGDPETLREEIRAVVRDRLAAYEYPREIEFVEELPQTTTGKIQRAALREREE